MKKCFLILLGVALCACLCACNMGDGFSDPFGWSDAQQDGQLKPTGNTTVIVDPQTGETIYIGESSTVIVNPDGSVAIGSGDDGSAIVIGPGNGEEEDDFLSDEE